VTGFGRLLADLNGSGVRYVVVGGIAVIRHGVVRATKDLDVVVATDDATAAALSGLREVWQATRPDGSAEDRLLPTGGWPLHLRTVHGFIDLLAEQPPPFHLDGLLSRAEERRVDGVPAPICSLTDLVALKRHAGRPSDLEDLSRLETAHGTLPDPPTTA
jgi:predicted nucleotidyltransferase